MDTLTSGGGIGYPDSLDSSPRSRGGESWDEPFLSAAASRLRLMCSYGGRIVPRPTDKSLCYLGGETRMVVVERLSTLSELSARLSRSILGGRPFSLKYQLPNEDLDSLISVTTDEDLENMIEEYDRIAASNPAAAAAGSGSGSTRSSRLRIFLFPSKSESTTSSITSLLDDSKSDTWFVDALNSAMGMEGGFLADSASVNSLLGLEDDSSVHSRVAAANAVAPSEPEQRLLPRPGSVPDSPMLDNSSSFGSTSSAPSLSNPPLIRVSPDDHPPDQRIGGLEGHFAQMNLSAAAAVVGQRQEDVLTPHHHRFTPPIPLPLSSASTSTISPTENPNRIFSSDDEKSEHGGVRKQPQQKPTPADAPISDLAPRPIYYQEKSSSSATAVNPIFDHPKQELPISDPSYRMPIQAPDTRYVLPPMQPEQHHHHHQQQQQQFTHGSHHYVHPSTGAVLPIPSYYQMPYPIQQQQPPQQQQQQQQFDQQIPMYFLPMRPNPSYNLSLQQQQQQQQPNMTDSSNLPKLPAKPELPSNLYRTAAPQPQLVHMAADQGYTYPGMGYHHMVHHQHSAPAGAMGNYGYEYAAEPAHQQQVYYSQTISPPALPPQYQMMSADAAAGPQMHPGEARQTRAS